MKKFPILPVIIALLLSMLYGKVLQKPIDSPCAAIAKLDASLKQSKHPEKILFQMGELAQKMEMLAPLEIEIYQKNPAYKSVCHFKVVKSENFGDFPSYSGYHYAQILEKYPHSDLADDAAYALVYVITEDTYNFSDTRLEKKKLESFLNNYPASNKASAAKSRIKEIEAQLKRGESPILD